jgi:hypothetical protein
MTTAKSTTYVSAAATKSAFPLHGWLGAALAAGFWALNWGMSGPRTHWGFFPMWLGYCLAVDGLVLWRTGTSLLARSPRKYISLFVVSAPVWWLFEILNLRTQNWIYLGAEQFSPLAFGLWTTLSFTTVIPAVFGSAELISSFGLPDRFSRGGPILRPDARTTACFFAAGWIMLALMLAWPEYFFPFLWLSIYFILEPINVWLGHRSLAEWTGRGDWRPVLALWLGVLLTGFFWEMWNFFSYPKWIYSVPWVGSPKLFEMPMLGYGGYLPFSLELYAIYHVLAGLFGEKDTDYIRIGPPPARESAGSDGRPVGPI